MCFLLWHCHGTCTKPFRDPSPASSQHRNAPPPAPWHLPPNFVRLWSSSANGTLRITSGVWSRRPSRKVGPPMALWATAARCSTSPGCGHVHTAPRHSQTKNSPHTFVFSYRPLKIVFLAHSVYLRYAVIYFCAPDSGRSRGRQNWCDRETRNALKF